MKQASHLLTLMQGLLPSNSEPPHLPPRILALLAEDSDDEDDDLPSAPVQVTLRQIRQLNLSTGKHDHSWNENMGIPAHKFAVGDLGYIPEERLGFDHFVLLGNVLKGKGNPEVGPELDVQVSKSAWGDQWCWKVIPVKRELMQGYDLPADVKWSANACLTFCPFLMSPHPAGRSLSHMPHRSILRLCTKLASKK